VLIAVIAIASCKKKDPKPPTPAFVAVTDITGVPTTATAGTALTLTGTVAPATATNKTITWAVKTAGTTGATISSSTLNTTAAGEVTVTATIAGGATASTPFTSDFTVTVAAAAPTQSITFTTTTQTVAQGVTAQYDYTRNGFSSISITTEWYSTSAGTGTPVSRPAGLSVGFSATSINIGTNYNSVTTPPGTYYFRAVGNGTVLSSNVATLIVTPPAPTIAVTATGLSNLKVGTAVSSASIFYTLSNANYASSITESNFAVSDLPAGLKAGTAICVNSTMVAINIDGTPTTANASTVTVTRPSTIPASNVQDATAAVAVSGTITAGPIAPATPTITISADGLSNLKVGTPLNNAFIYYFLNNGTYANSITPDDFKVSGLPAGLTASVAARTLNNIVAISVSGTPTTANASTITLTYPSTIPASNVQEATAPVAVSGTITAGPIASNVPTPTIAATATGLSNLQVGKAVSGQINFTLSNGQYIASPYPADFGVSGLPPGLVVSGMMRTSNTLIAILIGGTPTTANSSTVTLTPNPSTIPARNVTGATAAVAVSGNITAGPVAAATP
jgi:hypothetical protein